MSWGKWFAPTLTVALLLTGSGRSADADETGPTPAQKQAIYAKPSVVRVVAVWEATVNYEGVERKVYSGGHGSGFFVSADGFIATNAHVVRDIYGGEAAARRSFELRTGGLPLTSLKKKAEVVLPDGTTLPYEVKAYGAPVGEGKDVAIIKVNTKNAPNLVIGDSDKMALQDPVIALGYPGAADLQGLFDQKSQLEASITDGAVSAIKHTSDGEPVLQVTTPITHGNSGGPAINLRGEVIGLATFGNNEKVQGFNFLVASSTVKKFVKEAKANNAPSETQVRWRKALEAQWSGDYAQAIIDYEDVSELFPPHSEAPRMLKLAHALKKENKGKPPVAKSDKKDEAKAEGGGNGGMIAGIVGGVLLLGVGGIVVAKKKKATGPLPLGAFRPPGPPPPGAAMMGGRVAKTVALNAGHAPVAATAFGSMAIGALTCTRGLLQGQRFSLTGTGLLIGRQPGHAQIVVNDSRASGKHVWIGYENGALVAIDQGTTNGTFVNDVRLGRISKAPLKDGDTVIVAEPDCLSLTLKLG